MPIPEGLGAIDLMISFPSADARGHYDNLRALAKDAESKEMEFPAEYMFKQVPNYLPEGADPIEITLQEMDFCGVAAGLIGNPYFEIGQRALKEHPDRFFAGIEIDPNDITGAVRKIRKAKDDADIKAVTTFPAGCTPQVPVSDRRYYPIYQTCIDLDIPIISNAGIPGPRVPAACQDVMHFDEVCYDFPELRIIMRHGAEPWEALAVKLMLKWPGLYYMPSAFAPKYYPKAIIDYANSRGSDKVMYAGYYPMGLSLRRIFEEMPGVPLKDQVWPKFLRNNAIEVLKLDLPKFASRPEVTGAMLIDLKDRTALVTGAGRSVGRGIAEVLATAGAFVYVNDLHAERADEVVAAIESKGGAARTLAFDVTDSQAVARGFAAVESDDSSIEILVNNAGIAEGTKPVLFSESGADDWQPTVDLNLYGSMNLIRNCLPSMIEHRFGRIIQISSGAGSTGLSIGVSAYGAAKAAAESLIRHVAVENGRHGITANALALGLMANVGATVNEGVLRLLKGVPVGRLGQPEEVGLAAAWLASDGGGFVTGQVIHLNGGSTFGR